jgi:hypothetical protein
LSRELERQVVAKSAPPRLALRIPDEAAVALGVSPDFFDEHVRHELRMVRRGRLVFVAVTELERWLETNAAQTLRSQ